MSLNRLSDRQIRAAKVTGKEYRLGDGGGLDLVVRASGAKNWLFRYSSPLTGRVRKMGLGGYPALGLAAARAAAASHREQVALGLDPIEARAAARLERQREADLTFKSVAEAWFSWNLSRGTWTAKNSRQRVRGLLDNHILPWIGAAPLAEVSRRDVAILLQRVEAQGLRSAPRDARGVIARIYDFALEFHGFPEEKNFMRSRNVGALAAHETRHHPTILEHERIGKLMVDLRALRGNLLTRTAVNLLPYLWQRPGELRKMRWEDLDLGVALWTIPAAKMKQRRDHVVPLPRQAVAWLRDLRPLTGALGRGPVFPNQSRKKKEGASPYMSDATINKALRRAGYCTKTELTGHGFRAMARTILPEHLGVPEVWVERHLSHVPKETHGAAYDRAKYLEQRREMAQLWADFLDRLMEKGRGKPPV